MFSRSASRCRASLSAPYSPAHLRREAEIVPALRPRPAARQRHPVQFRGGSFRGIDVGVGIDPDDSDLLALRGKTRPRRRPNPRQRVVAPAPAGHPSSRVLTTPRRCACRSRRFREIARCLVAEARVSAISTRMLPHPSLGQRLKRLSRPPRASRTAPCRPAAAGPHVQRTRSRVSGAWAAPVCAVQ